MTLRASSTLRSVTATQGGLGSIAVFEARDPLLDALAFSRGRFGIAIAGIETSVPTWPEITRVLEDCRDARS